MPQTTYRTVYAADYPILAKAQKPGGVTVLSAVSANDVPNKHTYTAGTIQMLAPVEELRQITDESETQAEEVEAEVEEESEDEDPEPTPHRRRSTRRHR